MKPRLIAVTDPEDPRLSPYRGVRERDLVGRHGLFVAEGKVVLRLLLSSGRFGVESVLLLENRVAGAADILEGSPRDVPVYVASAAVMDAVAGFHVHRGILAIGRRGELPSAESLVQAAPARAVLVVAVGISNHDNVGAIFRNAAAFGADAVLLDKASCDPLYRKAIRVSVGAALTVPFTVTDDADALSDMLMAQGFECLAQSPDGERTLRAVKRGDRMALFLGTEGEGLPAALMHRLETVRIDMAPGFDSLNVAAASAIALHHLHDQ